MADLTLWLEVFPHLVRAVENWPDQENTMVPGLGGTAALITAGTCFGRWLNFPPDEEDDSPEEKERKKRVRRRLLAASAGHLGVAFVVFAAGFFDSTRVRPDLLVFFRLNFNK